MTDKALENAKSLKIKANNEILRLEEAIRLWRDRIAMAEQFIDQWNAFASGEAVNPVEIVSPERNKPEPSRTIRNTPKEIVAEAARDVILARNAPISRDELYDLLTQRRDLVIQGKDPRMVLSTMLWRMKDRVARLKNGGYWPAEIPNAEAGYDPTTHKEIDSLLAKMAHEILDPESEEYRDASENAG